LPHQWLMVFSGVALLVLGGILVCYILLLRYKAERLRLTLGDRRSQKQGNDEVHLSEAGRERPSWWEQQGSPETSSSEETRGSTSSGDTGDPRASDRSAREPWWRRGFGG
jgi:hypothetical protein